MLQQNVRFEAIRSGDRHAQREGPHGETAGLVETLPAETRDMEPQRKTLFIIIVVLTLTRIIKSVVTGQAPVALELRNTLEGKTQTTQSGTRIYHS